jgi:hypothetical protein
VYDDVTQGEAEYLRDELAHLHEKVCVCVCVCTS